MEPSQSTASNESLSVAQGLRISKLGLAINFVLAIGKTVTGAFGQSQALIADGIESTADVLSSLIVWGGLRLSIKPADASHPYGHGKAEPIATILVAFLLLLAATLIGIHSIAELQSPAPSSPRWFTLPVLVLVIITKETLFRIAARTGRGLESTALLGEAWHHRSDALTSAAAFVGISIALIGGSQFARADDWAALLACTVIAWNGFRLLRNALDHIMDAAVDPETTERIRDLAATVPGVRRIEKCRIRRSGLHLALDMHVVVTGSLTVRQGHDISHAVKDRLIASPLRINDVTVHIEPD